MGAFLELNHVLADESAGSSSSPPPRIGRLIDHLASGTRDRVRAGHPGSPVEVLLGMSTRLHAPVDSSRGVVDLAAISLDLVAEIPATIVRIEGGGGRGIGAPELGRPRRFRDRAVLIETGWDARWATGSYGEPGPFLTEAAAEILVAARARIVGVDFWDVDPPTASNRPVRSALLGAGIPLVENLTNLKALPPSGFLFSAVPLRVARGASIPVRAFAHLR